MDQPEKERTIIIENEEHEIALAVVSDTPEVTIDRLAALNEVAGYVLFRSPERAKDAVAGEDLA